MRYRANPVKTIVAKNPKFLSSKPKKKLFKNKLKGTFPFLTTKYTILYNYVIKYIHKYMN